MLFLPVMLSIFAITLSYDFAFTPVVAGLMLLANVYLIGWRRVSIQEDLRAEDFG